MKNKRLFFLPLALCILLFIYAPFEIYASNIDDIDYDLYDMMKILPLCALIIFTVLFAAMHVIDKFGWTKLQILLCSGMLWLLLSLLIQGTFFVSGIPVLTGDEIDWSGYGHQRLLSIIIYIGVAIIVYLIERITKEEIFLSVCSVLSGILSVMMVLSILLMCFTVAHLTDRKNVSVTGEYMLDMSSDENFVILVLDGMDAGKFEEVAKSHPEYKDFFTDFTFFRNTLGAYPLTGRSIPFIICGDWYECQTSPQEYAIHAFSESPLIKDLIEKEYRIGMYEAEMVPHREINLDSYENMNYFESRKLVRPYMFLKLQLKLVGIKYLPWQLKPFCTVTPDQVEYDAEISNIHSEMFSYDNGYFYNRVKNEPLIIEEKKCFRFIHVKGAHPPYDYDKEMTRIDNGTSRDGIEVSAFLANTYLNKLKEAGVYDNSVIIMMADHGYDHRQNPVLFIKGKGERHEYQISDAPISYVDLQDAFSKLLDGCGSEDAFEWREGDERIRRFLYYPFEDESTIYEMSQSGKASDNESLVQTGVVFSR